MKLTLVLLVGALFAVSPVLAEDPDSPAALVNAGWENYRLNEFGMAEKAFERAAAQGDPAGLYGLAVTWDLRRPQQDPAKAATLYRQVLEVAPASEWAPWSLLALARQPALLPPGKEPPLATLLAGYQAVIDRFPDHAAATEAFLYQMAARLGIPDATNNTAVLEKLHEFLIRQPQSPYRSVAWRLVGQACEMLGLPEQLLEAALQEWKTTEVDPRSPWQDLAGRYWRIATIAQFEVGDFATAREFYQKLIQEYPTEQRVFIARQELKRMDDLEAKLRQEMGRR